MSDIKKSVCGSCGFQWPTGQYGGHSCSSYLRTENASLKARIVELEGIIKETMVIIQNNQAVVDTIYYDNHCTLYEKLYLTINGDDKCDQLNLIEDN